MLYCPFCGAAYRTFGVLKRHYLISHVKNWKRCAVCGYTGSEESVMKHYSYHARVICDEWTFMHALHYILLKHRMKKGQIISIILPCLETYPPKPINALSLRKETNWGVVAVE
ncbi:MAG: hypothetical protein QW175_07825 [Candidatus Bathyarchaeia archaeon]